VLGYRLVNFWLPIPAGGGTYLSLRFTSEGWRERIRSVHEDIVEQHLAPIEGGGGSDATAGGSQTASSSQGAPTPDEGIPKAVDPLHEDAGHQAV
jgi:hypothetical protein